MFVIMKWLLITLIFYPIFAEQSVGSSISRDDFYNSIYLYRTTEEITETLSRFIETLSSLPLGSCLSDPEPLKVCSTDYARSALCSLCQGIVETVLQYYHEGYTADEIADLLVDMCVVMELQPERVCRGMADINKDIIFYIIDNKPTLTPDEACSTLFQTSGCGVVNNSTDWTIDVDLGDKPVKVQTRDLKGKQEIITILQITDVHYDPLYVPGNNAECGAPTCCREEDGIPSDSSSGAGSWGDYRNCDLPMNAILSMLDHIKAQFPVVDYVYFTGDVIDHAVWRTSREYNNASFSTIFNLFREYFGAVPVYPTVGNHESHPVNVFAPLEITNYNVSSEWLFESLAGYWSMWLPSDSLSTVLQGGHYTTLLRPGLRLVVLNNLYCYHYNFWLMYEDKDLGGQLTWLANTLLKAEANNEKVHILSHIPPGSSDCMYPWSKEFRRIIDRFENTVMAIFNGHTHNDEYHIFYSVENATHPTCVAFNGGSATTYSYLNPNYRVYKVDATTGEVLDHETWIYNMTAANLYPDQNPVWYKMYSFLEAYGVDSLTPSSLDALSHRMAAEPDLIRLYRRFHIKEADPLLAGGCDEDCLVNSLCQTVTTFPLDTTQCDILKEELFATLNQTMVY